MNSASSEKQKGARFNSERLVFILNHKPAYRVRRDKVSDIEELYRIFVLEKDQKLKMK